MTDTTALLPCPKCGHHGQRSDDAAIGAWSLCLTPLCSVYAYYPHAMEAPQAAGVAPDVSALASENSRLREALEKLERYVALNCWDEWLPDGNKKSRRLKGLLHATRAALTPTQGGEG